MEEGDGIRVTCNIHNTGSYAGAEIVQLYIRNPQNKVFMAEKELKVFTKLYLQPGETKQATMSFQRRDLAYYNKKAGSWILENGTYGIVVGASSTDLRLEAVINITGEVEMTNPYPREEGHKIQIRLGETLETDGEFTQRNFQCNSKGPILQQLTFKCSGKQDHYKQKFTVSGFRYALMEN